MGNEDFEAERLLKQLNSLNLTSSRRDPAGVEAALKALYGVVQLTFPEFRWAPNLQETVLDPMRTAWARFCAAGAARTPTWTFQGLHDAALSHWTSQSFKGVLQNFFQRFEMRCGSEPRDFV